MPRSFRRGSRRRRFTTGGATKSGFGYSQRRVLARSRRAPKRKIFRAKRFGRAVRKAVQNFMLEKANVLLYNTYRVASTNSTTYGTQTCKTILQQNSLGDINLIYGKMKTALTVASGGTTIPTGTTPAQKFTITTYIAEIMMKNACNNSVVVDIYLVLPRQDAYGPPEAVMTSSIADQAASGLSNSTFGLTPYMLSGFCTLYKIVKKYRYVLAPGATQAIDYRDNKNYNINYERINLQSNLSDDADFKGLTKNWMAIVHGEPINDSGTATEINSSPFAVDFLTTETYYYTYAINNTTYTNQFGTFGTITTPVTTLQPTGATGVTPATS